MLQSDWVQATMKFGNSCVFSPHDTWTTVYYSGLVRITHEVISVRCYMRDHLCLDDLYKWCMRDHPRRSPMRNDLYEMIYRRLSLLDDPGTSPIGDHLSRDDLRKVFVSCLHDVCYCVLYFKHSIHYYQNKPTN